MNIGKLLGIASPGLSATGLFGHSAQGSGSAMLGGMSPVLAALFHKQKGGAPVMPARPQDASPVGPTASVLAAPQAMAQAPGPNVAEVAAGLPQAKIHDPTKRRQAGLALLQLGSQFANPFGQRLY